MIVAALAVSSFSATAGDRGKFQGHAVLNNTKFNEFKAPDGHPYKSAWSGEQEGWILPLDTLEAYPFVTGEFDEGYARFSPDATGSSMTRVLMGQ